MQRIDNAGSGDNGGAMLIIMENWYIHAFAQLLFDNKTFWRFDIFKINPAKSRCQQCHGFDKFFRICGVQFQINAIDISKFFE